VTKLNKAGAIEWQKSFGGNLGEEGRDIKVTPDGGYIVIGWTSSTDTFVSPNHGIWDICVFKLDKNGNLQWKRNYGGSNLDEGYSVEVVSDGYMLFGELLPMTAISPEIMAMPTLS
jgi:hypothetical protein